MNKLSDKISFDCTHLQNSPRLAVIASISLGLRLRGRPFCRGCCGRPEIEPAFEPDELKC